MIETAKLFGPLCYIVKDIFQEHKKREYTYFWRVNFDTSLLTSQYYVKSQGKFIHHDAFQTLRNSSKERKDQFGQQN